MLREQEQTDVWGHSSDLNRRVHALGGAPGGMRMSIMATFDDAGGMIAFGGDPVPGVALEPFGYESL